MTFPNNRVHVVGLGLLGGSLAGALTRAGYLVSGEDIDESLVDAARRAGFIASVEEGASLVVVAAPPQVSETIVRELLISSDDELVVTDIASVKSPISQAISDPRFIPGHPMAGSARRAPDGWDRDMFVGASWIVTDLEKRSTTAAHRVSALISAVGAREHHSSAERHDQLVALTSHLPYLLAVELRDLLTASDDEASVFVGPAFQGATRVAEANRDLFSEIVALNATNIRAVSERLIADLSRRLDL